MKTKEEENIANGEKIYDNFCKNFGASEIMTPRISTLIIFSELKRLGESELLLREMMKEFITNLTDKEITLRENNRVCEVCKDYQLL
jgi:hypothetical protein